MASSKVVSRLSSRLQPLALKLGKVPHVPEFTPLKSCSQSQASASAGRVSRISRLPLELSSVETIMPLHSAIASARLVSSLSAESKSWCLVPQAPKTPCDTEKETKHNSDSSLTSLMIQPGTLASETIILAPYDPFFIASMCAEQVSRCLYDSLGSEF